MVESICQNCIDDQCKEKNDVINDKWMVEAAMENLTLTEMNVTELKNTISNMTGIDSDEFSLGYEVDGNGYVVRVTLYVKDEESCSKLLKIINEDCLQSVNHSGSFR